MSESLLVVSDAQLADQVMQGSMIRDSHYVWVNPDMRVLTEEGPRTAQEVTWYLIEGYWPAALYNLCGDEGCLLLEHNTPVKADAEAAKEEALLALVERSTPSLASLVQKGKARGLISPRSEYGG